MTEELRKKIRELIEQGSRGNVWGEQYIDSFIDLINQEKRELLESLRKENNHSDNCTECSSYGVCHSYYMEVVIGAELEKLQPAHPTRKE